MLQSENDSGTTPANLSRHLINELYFAMDDIETAAGGNRRRRRRVEDGREYLNAYVTIVNFPLNERRRQFRRCRSKPPPPPLPPPPPPRARRAAAAAAPAA